MTITLLIDVPNGILCYRIMYIPLWDILTVQYRLEHKLRYKLNVLLWITSGNYKILKILRSLNHKTYITIDTRPTTEEVQ